MNATNFVPPSDVDMEQSILCQIMLDPTDAVEYLDSLAADDFYRTSHRKIFETMQGMFGLIGSVGPVELISELGKSGHLEEVGGASYISSLMDTLPPSSTEYAITTVHHMAVRRRAIELCNAGIKRALASGDAVELVDYLQTEFNRLEPSGISANSCVSLSDGITCGLEKWEAAAAAPGSNTGVRTGLRLLDYLTCGFQPTDLIILAARPSMGKTALSVGWALSAAESKKPALFFSLEQSSSQLITRAVSSHSQVNSHKFKTGYFADGELDLVRRASRNLKGLPVVIDDAGGITVQEIRRRARRIARRDKIKIIFVDHLQLVTPGRRSDNRNQELGEITRALKNLAKELSVPVVVLSQLNRNLESRVDKRPRLSDLRESGNIEQDADVVISIYRPEVYGTEMSFEGYSEIALLKHRDGPTGVVISKFSPKNVRFYDLEQDNGKNLLG